MKITRMTTPLLTMMLFHSRSLTTRGVTAFSAGPTLRRPLQYSTSFRPLRMVKARGAGYGAPVQNVGEMVGNTYVFVCCRACCCGRFVMFVHFCCFSLSVS